MSFNASDYIKPPSPEYATDREIQGDQYDLKINDLRRDTIACINALASGAPTGSVTVDSISATPTTITAVKNLTPPVIYGTVGQRVVATPIGIMILCNCSFDGTSFTADDTANVATGILLTLAGTTNLLQVTTATPWTVWEFSEIYDGSGAVYNTSTKSATILSVKGAISVPSSPNPFEVLYTLIPLGRSIGFVPVLNVTVSDAVNVVGPYTATLVAGRYVKVTCTTGAAYTPSSVVFTVGVNHP